MEYCSAVWDPYEKGDTETLEKVQRRAAHFVKGDYRQQSSITQMIKDLGWQSLQERRAISRLSMYKITHGLSEVQLPNLMRKTRTTRSASGKGFRNVSSNKNCYRSTFLPRTIPEWNNLPDKIRNAPSLKKLVNRSNQHQRSRPIQSLLLINRLLTFPVPDNQFLVISTVTFRFRFRTAAGFLTRQLST